MATCYLGASFEPCHGLGTICRDRSLPRVPECPYQELATVTASEGALAGGVNTYLPAMKRRARELGGDALVGYKTANTTAGYVAVAPNVTAAVDGEIHSAVVVRFTKPDCMK